MNTKLLTLKEYCPLLKNLPLTREDIIKQQVEREERHMKLGYINLIPKVSYPTYKKMNPAPFYAFIKSILP